MNETSVVPMEHGIYLGVPFQKYLADELAVVPSLNAGTAATLVSECPKMAWYGHARLNPTGPGKQSKAMDNGTMCHAILLEGNFDKIAVIDPQDHRSKPTKDNPDGSIPVGWTNNAIRAARDDARALGKIPVLTDDFAGIQNMVDAAHEYIQRSEIAQEFAQSDREVTLLYQDAGIWLRGRPDALTKDRRIVIDVKTTAGSADPDQWARTQANGHNEIQAALGLRGLRVLAPDAGEDRKHIWLVIEQTAPYLCSLVAPDPAALALAESKLERAMLIWAKCLKTGEWPGYPERICWMQPAPWELTRWEEKEALQGETI